MTRLKRVAEREEQAAIETVSGAIEVAERRLARLREHAPFCRCPERCMHSGGCHSEMCERPPPAPPNRNRRGDRRRELETQLKRKGLL